MMNNNIEKGINKIRLQLYEETKNFSAKELAERANKENERIAKKYNIKISSK